MTTTPRGSSPLAQWGGVALVIVALWWGIARITEAAYPLIARWTGLAP